MRATLTMTPAPTPAWFLRLSRSRVLTSVTRTRAARSDTPGRHSLAPPWVRNIKREEKEKYFQTFPRKLFLPAVWWRV